MARGGDAVVLTERGVVLAPMALPGERVELGPARKVSGALRAEVRAVLEPSSHRVSPACPLAGRCGGCPWMIATLEHQREMKRELLRSALPKGSHHELAPLIGEPSGLGYRRRARLLFVDGRLGYRARAGAEVVDVEACPVLRPALGRLLERARPTLLAELRGRAELRLYLGLEGRGALALSAERDQPPSLYAALEGLATQPDIAGVSLRIGEARPAIWGDPRERMPGADGVELLGTTGGFSQANDAIAIALARALMAAAAPRGGKALELYAGHGTFSILLARASALRIVEQDPEAIQAARENLRARELEAEICEGDALEQLGRGSLELAILDPPRGGARGLLAPLAARRPKRIVYVSCDTATLRRDLGELAGLGYGVRFAQPFDMFPQTARLESLVVLEPDRALSG